MNLWQSYLTPTHLSDALLALHSAPGPAVPIAGGTDLLLDLAQGRHAPANTLVDVTAVEEMLCLELRNGKLFIGASVPLSRIAQDPLVTEHALALAEACDLIGGPQVRNVATLGGNVAHALPAADGTIALLALDAMVEIASLEGGRVVPMDQLFAGPAKSTLKRGQDLIVGFHVSPRSVNTASAFMRVMRPQGVALPIVNLAAWMYRETDLVRGLRVAVGPGGPRPWRALMAEQALIGQPFGAESKARTVQALLDDVAFRSSPRRATSEYRRHLVEPLLIDTLEIVWERTHA
jgi:carbon-monoxide dehydrogenase medium subunit